jgi:hypothetical protein
MAVDRGGADCLPGASVQAIDRTGYRLAVAAEHAMQGGTHYAEFTVLALKGGTLLGVALATVDIEVKEAYKTNAFWGVRGRDGCLYGENRKLEWPGMNPYGLGDKIGLLLELDAAPSKLTVYKNDQLLGSMFPFATSTGVQNRSLCWAVALDKKGDQVGIVAAQPPLVTAASSMRPQTDAASTALDAELPRRDESPDDYNGRENDSKVSLRTRHQPAPVLACPIYQDAAYCYNVSL